MNQASFTRPSNSRKKKKDEGSNGVGYSPEDEKVSNERKDEGSDDAGNSGDASSGGNEDEDPADPGNSEDDIDSDKQQEEGLDSNRNSGDEVGDPGDQPGDSEDMYFRDPNAPVTDWHYYPELGEPRRDPSWEEAEKLSSKLKDLNKKECERFMDSIERSPPPLREPSNRACEGYDGVLQIHHYDHGGASGASFFLFTIGMLAWADQHNYLPWIHIEDGWTVPIWDPSVHMNRTSETKFTMMEGMDIEMARDPDDPQWYLFPGKPFKKEEKLKPKRFVLRGTGVWEHYFLPVNDFAPGDSSCREKPLLRMNDDHIVPGIHANAPWAPRAWRYVGADYLSRDDLEWDDWFRPQRKRGAQMTERYIRFNPMMEKRAHCAFPNPGFSLGMHIRHSDKVVERRVIEVDEFLPFAKAFIRCGGNSIYIATDSTKVIESIFKQWPKRITKHVVYQPSVMGRSSNETAAFDIGVSRHRTNVEALTDVIALSKTSFLLHGLSAMSEAVMFLNPELATRSKNLEEYSYVRQNSRPVRDFRKAITEYRREYEERLGIQEKK